MIGGLLLIFIDQDDQTIYHDVTDPSEISTACVLKQHNVLRRYLRKTKTREMKQEEINYQFDLIWY
jgi:hypothetical protein